MVLGNKKMPLMWRWGREMEEKMPDEEAMDWVSILLEGYLSGLSEEESLGQWLQSYCLTHDTRLGR